MSYEVRTYSTQTPEERIVLLARLGFRQDFISDSITWSACSPCFTYSPTKYQRLSSRRLFQVPVSQLQMMSHMNVRIFRARF